MKPQEKLTFHLDEEAFRKKIPYTLLATNVPGAFATPAPPADFNPATASAATLAKYGLLWRRPQPNDDPRVVAVWNKVFSRTWLAKDRIVPQFQVQQGKTHLVRNLRKASNTSYLTTSWSGCAIEGSWNTAFGYWTIPTVSKPPEPQGTEGGWNSSSWIGIDGFFISNDVLQAGIQQHVDASGHASYVAWYEWYAPPQAGSPGYVWQTNIPNFPVSPGQQVYCSVQYVSNHAGYLYFANETTGQYFSITLAPPPGASFAGNTIEWIMEAPDGGEPTSSMPKFTPVHFTTALGCGTNVVGDPKNGLTVNLETAGGKVLTSVALASESTTINFIG